MRDGQRLPKYLRRPDEPGAAKAYIEEPGFGCNLARNVTALTPTAGDGTSHALGPSRLQEVHVIKPVSVLTILALSISLSACSKKEKAGTKGTASAGLPSTAAVPPSEAAKTYFKTKCVVCHGAKGAGDGPGSAALDPKPAAFGDAKWQDGITDDEIAKIIVEGGAAVGKSTAMPPNPDLKGKDVEVKALVKLIRGWRM